MKKYAAILTVLSLIAIGSGSAFAGDMFGEGTWLGPDADDMAKAYHEGTPIAREKSYGFFGPDASEVAKDFHEGTPASKSASTDFFGFPKGDPNYTAF